MIVKAQKGFVQISNSVAANTVIEDDLQDFINSEHNTSDSEKVTLDVNGDIAFVEVFRSSSQVESNRKSKTTYGYDVNLQPITETCFMYDTNGTTILKTVTSTLTWANYALEKITKVTT